MAQFVAKTKPPDWTTLLAIDPIQVVENLDDELLERLYPALVSTKIEPSDPKLTIENMLHLFGITQLCMEVKNIFLEEAEGTIVSMQETVTQQNRELKQLKSTGPNYLRDDDEIFQLKVANEELAANNEDLTIKLRKAEENLEIETSRVDGVNMELKNERTKSRQLSETIEELNLEVKELRTFRDQSFGKKAEDEYKSQIRDKNNAINRYLAEIQQLSVQNNQLTADFETLTIELEAAVTELEANSQEIENLQKSISQYEEKTKKFLEEGDLLRKSENDLSEKIKERDQRILELETQLKESKDQFNVIKSDLLNKDHTIETLEEELQVAKASFSQIHDLKGQVAEKDGIIQDLQKQIEEGYRDFELLSLDWQQVEEVMKNKPTTSEARQTLGIIQELKSKFSVSESQNNSLLIKVQKLVSELAAKEERLSGITKKLQDYENGVYGLKEAREEIDSLILQKKLREDDIVALTKKCNSLQFSVDELTQENHDLRSLLGPEHADVDIAKSSKTRGKTELEKLQSLNARLTSEIDQLEEERLQLKSQLRLHALQKGETALKLGLTAEEMITVDNFIAKIRADKDTVGGCDQKQADVNGPNAHIEHIICQLEDVQRELRSAREEHRLTETRLRDLNEENQKLQQAIIQLTTALPEGNRERTQTSDLAERIIEYLEQKAANGLTKPDSSLSTTSQEKYQALNETSTLRSELLRLRETILERESQMDLLQKRITELESEITEQHDFYLEITASHTPKCSVKPDVRSVGICTHEVSADSVGSPPSPLPSGGLSGNSSIPAGSRISTNDNRRTSTRSVQVDIGVSRWPSLSHSQLSSNTHGTGYIEMNPPSGNDALSHLAILPSQTEINFSNIVSDDAIGISSEKLETVEYSLNNSHSESSHMNNLIDSYKSLKRQFEADRHKWEAKLNKCRSENEHLLSLSNQHEWTIQQLQDTLTVLNFEPDSIQTKYQDLSRKVILSRLTEKQLSRKISVLLENEELHRRDNKALQDKLEDLERKNMVSNNELSIAYEQSLEKLEKLEADLQDSVSKTAYSFIECKLLAVLAKYEHLLEKQVEDVKLKAKCNTAIRELEETRIESNTLRTELEVSQKQCEQLNLAIESIKQLPDSEELNNLTSLRRENCILQQKIASLQVQVEAATKRAALSDTKGMAFLQVEKELKTALDELQQQYLECKEENVRLRDSESALQQQLEQSVTKVEVDQRIKQVSELESKIVEIQRECSKYKMLAEVAMSQVNDMLHLKSRSSDESEQLRQALSDLQSESDQKLLVGNLHRQIMNLQRSEANFKKAAETLQTKCYQLESSLSMTEQKLSDRELRLYRLRRNYYSKIQTLQTRLMELRLKYGNGSSLLKAEKLINRLREVQETANRLNKSVTELRVGSRELSNALAEAKLQLENEQDLVRSVKEGNHDLGRMKLFHDKVAELKLVNMRLNREVAFLREKQLMHEKEIEQRLQTMSELEERLVKAEAYSEKLLIDFESREMDLEKVIHQYEEEREKAIKAAANFQDKPDGNLPLHEQLESACILIAQKNEVILSQNAAIQKLEAEAEVLASNYKEAESKAVSCESRAAALELQVAKYAQAESFAKSRVGPNEHQIEEMTVTLAQTIISSLQLQLDQKDETLQKYQNMVSQLRRDFEIKRAADRNQIQSLADKIIEYDKLNVIRMSKSHYELQMVPTKESDDVISAEDFRVALQAKENEIALLQTQIQQYYIADEATRVSQIRAEETAKTGTDQQIEHSQTGVREKDNIIQRLEIENNELKMKLEDMASSQTKSKKDEGLESERESILREVDMLREANKRLKILSEKRQDETEEAQLETEKWKAQIATRTSAITAEMKRLQRINRDLKSKIREDELRAAELAQKLAAVGTSNEDQRNEWEREKKWQKKIEILKEQLKQKTTEVESLQKQNVTLSSIVSRLEKDRTNQNKHPPLSMTKDHLNGDIIATAEKLVQKVENNRSGNPTADARSKLAEAIIKIYKEKGESCNVDQVIEKFASAIDRLEAEREHLKQTTVSAAKYMEVSRELKQMKKERTESMAKAATNQSENKTSEDISQLKRQSNAQAQSILELKRSNETKAKEIASLKRKLASAHSLLEENSNNSEVMELKKQLTEKEETIIHLLNSEAKLNQPHYENNIRKLKTEIDTWRAKYEKLKKKITGNEVLNNGDGAISDELATLKQQNETLQKEISAFKEKRIDLEESQQHLKALETNQLGLLEELEDLKINYQEAVNLNVVYEDELQRHGVNVDMLKELGQISM